MAGCAPRGHEALRSIRCHGIGPELAWAPASERSGRHDPRTGRRDGPAPASSRGGRAGLRHDSGSRDPGGAEPAAGPDPGQVAGALARDRRGRRRSTPGSARTDSRRRRASARLALHGPNRLPEPPRAGLARIYARQFASPLIYLLLAASVVSLAIGEHTDAAFIFAVLQLNALFGAFQEWKAQSSASALARLTRSMRRCGATDKNSPSTAR